MKPVSREMAQRLKDAGWVKDTAFVYNSLGHLIYFPRGPEDELSPHDIPAPTLDEVLGELPCGTNIIKENDNAYYATIPIEIPDMMGLCRGYVSTAYVNPADAAAEVWLKTRTK